MRYDPILKPTNIDNNRCSFPVNQDQTTFKHYVTNTSDCGEHMRRPRGVKDITKNKEITARYIEVWSVLKMSPST